MEWWHHGWHPWNTISKIYSIIITNFRYLLVITCILCVFVFSLPSSLRLCLSLANISNGSSQILQQWYVDSISKFDIFSRITAAAEKNTHTHAMWKSWTFFPLFFDVFDGTFWLQKREKEMNEREIEIDSKQFSWPIRWGSPVMVVQ